MSRLPTLRPRQVVSVLERAGFVVVRVVGSHYQMFNPKTHRRTTVPIHNRDLARRFQQSSNKPGSRETSS